MPQDNLAGAPTEGLGQTVTFAFDPGRAVQQQTIDQGQLNIGVRQSGDSGRSTISGAPITGGGAMTAATLDVLGKLAGNTVKPILEKAKLDRFSAGVQQAASGKAIQEVADEQPWYATLFGEADAVEGARAYHSADKALSIRSELASAMDGLRKLSPHEARPLVNEVISKHLTGDSYADASITQAVTRELPGFWKTHTKENIKYTQELAAGEKLKFMTSAATEYGNSFTDTGDPIEGISRFREALRLPEGGNLEEHAKQLAHVYTVAGTTGNIRALDAMREDVAAMPDAMQRHMETIRVRAEARKLSEVFSSDSDTANQVAMLRAASGDMDPKAYREAALEINRAYSAKYGGSGPVTQQEIEMGMAAGYDAQYQAAKKAGREATTADDKAVAAEQERAAISRYIDEGTIADAVARRVVTAAEADAEMFKRWTDNSVSPGVKFNSLVRNHAYPSLVKHIQQSADIAFTVAPGAQPTWGPQQEAQYKNWQELAYNGGKFNPAGAVAAQTYWGDKRHAMFLEIEEGKVLYGKTAGQSYADTLTRAKRPPVDQKAASAALKSFVGRSEFKSIFGVLGDTEFTPSSMGVLERQTQQAMEVYPNMPPAQAVPLFINSRRKAGRLQVVGKHVWESSSTGPTGGFTAALQGLNQTSGAGVKIPSDQVAPVLELAIDKYATDLYPDGASTEIEEGYDENGTPRIVLFIVSKDGERSTVLPVTPNQLLLRASKEYREGLIKKPNRLGSSPMRGAPNPRK